MRIHHQVRMVKRISVNFQVFFDWCNGTLCPEVQVECRLSLLFNSEDAKLLIAETPVMVQVQRIEDLLGLLLTHSHSQLV